MGLKINKPQRLCISSKGIFYNSSKSQASLEMMTTYFWVLLSITIVIGALWYFGILNPKSKAPDRCSIGPNIDCKEYLIAETQDGAGVLRLKLENNFAETLVVTGWELTTDGNKPITCTGAPFTGSWEDGATIDVEFKGCDSAGAGFVLGEKSKVNVKMLYRPAKADATFTKAIEGEIFAGVTPTNVMIGEQGSGTLQCYVATSCSGSVTASSTVVFGMSTAIDAVTELPTQSNYGYKVCCTSTASTLSNSCASPEVVVLHLSGNTEAHVEKNTQSNYNAANNVCISADTGTISCVYRATPCAADETCMATISGDTDAHVSDCTTADFPNRICCKWA